MFKWLSKICESNIDRASNDNIKTVLDFEDKVKKDISEPVYKIASTFSEEGRWVLTEKFCEDVWCKEEVFKDTITGLILEVIEERVIGEPFLKGKYLVRGQEWMTDEECQYLGEAFRTELSRRESIEANLQQRLVNEERQRIHDLYFGGYHAEV